MGACLVQAELRHVVNELHECLTKLGYDVTTSFESKDGGTLSGCARCRGGFTVDCRWQAHEDPNGTFLSLDLRPTRQHRRFIVALFTVLCIFLLLIAVYVFLQGNAVVESCGFILLILLASLASFYTFYAYVKRSRFPARKEIEIWERIEEQHQCKKILPVDISLLGKEAETLLLGLFLLLLWGYFLSLAPIVAVTTGLLVLVALPYLVAYGLFRTNPFIQWRVQILRCIFSCATGLNFWPLVYLTISYVGYIALALYATGVCDSPSSALAEASSKLNHATMFTRDATAPKMLVKEIGLKYVDRQAYELYPSSPKPLEELRRRAASRLAFIRNVIVGAVLFMLVGEIIMIMLVPRNWQSALGKSGSVPAFRVPPIMSSKHRTELWQRASVGIFLSACGLLNLISLFVSMEIIYFVFTGNCDPWQLSYTLAWISFPYSELVSTTGSQPHFSEHCLALVVLFAFAVSPLVVPFLKSLKLAKRSIKRLWEWLNLPRQAYLPPEKVQDAASRLSSKAGVPKPLVRLLPDSRIRLSIRKRLYQTRARLYISSGALHNLNADELETTLAHEIAHLQQGLFSIELARFLSWLFLFPNASLHSLFDFVEKELDADIRAMVLTGKREPLISALIKMSIGYQNLKRNYQSTRPSWRRLSSRLHSFIKGYHLFNEFLSGDVMVGYTHPYLTTRIEAIRAAGADIR